MSRSLSPLPSPQFRAWLRTDVLSECVKGRRNEYPIPTWPLLNSAPGTNGPLIQKHLDFKGGSRGGEALLMELHHKRVGRRPEPAAFPITPRYQSSQQPRRLLIRSVGLMCTGNAAGRPGLGTLRARLSGAGAAGSRGEGSATWTDAHARSCRRRHRRPRPLPPPALRTREKSKQRRIGFCSIRGAGGGKSMFSKWEKRKSFRKDSLFPSRRGVRKQHRPLRRKHRGP